MYRLLDAAGEVKERRDQVRRPHYAAPELLATRPNEVWSWDITKLLGPVKWTYFYLYVILDIFSRYVVGWMIAPHESAALAERLIAETCAKYGIQAGQLTLHADRGGAMRSKPVALLLADLGVVKTHSRPYVSNDNPFSEAQFRTLKYCPQFPDRFGSIEDGRAFGQVFFPWYNQAHHHSGLGFLTPAVVHFGQAASCARIATACSPPPMLRIPSASCTAVRNPPICRPRSGSTRPSRKRRLRMAQEPRSPSRPTHSMAGSSRPRIDRPAS